MIICIYGFCVHSHTFLCFWLITLNIHEYIHTVVYSTHLIMHNYLYLGLLCIMQPTPVFLPGESQGQRSLVGYCPWGCTESDMTEVT